MREAAQPAIDREREGIDHICLFRNAESAWRSFAYGGGLPPSASETHTIMPLYSNEKFQRISMCLTVFLCETSETSSLAHHRAHTQIHT